MIEVFFYGLFMDTEVLERLGFQGTEPRVGVLADFDLRIGERVTLVRSAGHQVYGVVMRMAEETASELYGLDIVRGYEPRDVRVSLADGTTVQAVCYLLPEADLAPLLEVTPDAAHSYPAAIRLVGARADRDWLLERTCARSEAVRVAAAAALWMGMPRDGDAAATPRELGEVRWGHDLDAALAASATAGKPVFLFDAQSGEASDSILAHSITSALCVPLMTGELVTGVIYVDRRSEAVPFGDEDVAFFTTFAMPNREVHFDTIGAAAIFKENLHRVTDVALLRIEIVFRVLLVLNDFHLFAQRIDARIAGDVVFVVCRSQATKDQRHGGHVLNAVITICRIIERSGLVNDAHACFLRFDNDFLDVIDAVFDLRMQSHARLNTGL